MNVLASAASRGPVRISSARPGARVNALTGALGVAAALGALLVSVFVGTGAASAHTPYWYCHHHLPQCTSPLPTVSASSARSSSSTPSPTQSSSSSRTSTPTPTLTSSAPSGGGASLAGFFGPEFNAAAAFCTFQQQFATVSNGALTISYPAGSSAPSSGVPGGAQICEPFTAGPATDATLTYKVRFPVGFQFVKGGKLPGVYGGQEPFSGGAHTSNGWSLRLMWRIGGAGEIYGYTANTVGYGDDYTTPGFKFAADGQWHTIAERVHVNAPQASDGWATLSYDGKPVISQTGIDITNTNTPITGLFFSTFYGGHDSTWAPTANEHLDFAGFSVS